MKKQIKIRKEENQIIKALNLDMGQDVYSQNSIFELCKRRNIKCNMVQAIFISKVMETEAWGVKI